MPEKKTPVISRDNLETYTIAAVGGAFAQITGEAIKIIENIAPEKFPNGWQSLNLIEESLEGAIPMVVGAVLGKALYAAVRAKKDVEYSEKTERRYMFICAIAMYLAMAFVIGPILHEVLDIDDVKWLGF